MPDGRFAPSPTGDLHLGNFRTALSAWLFARSSGSRFLLRMEDLDSGSVRDRYYQRQADDLASLGLDWDGEVIRQTDSLDRHRDAISELERASVTYPCYCTRREIREAVSAPNGDSSAGSYPGTCATLSRRQLLAFRDRGRPPALRVRGNGSVISFNDRICGNVTGVVDDFVVMRNDSTPAYNLAVIVDDVAQGVRMVVRGDDLLASTPRQLHLASLLGMTAPEYAHVPLTLSPDGRRLAKRDGAVTLPDRLARGSSIAEVLTVLARSLRLVGDDDVVHPQHLPDLARVFDADRIPHDPWVLDDQFLRGR